METERNIRKARIEATADLLKMFFGLVDDWALNLGEQKILLGEETLLRLARRLDGDLEILVDDQTKA